MARTELPLCLLLAQIDRKKSELAGFVIENLPEEAKQQFRQRYEEMKAEGVALAAGRRRSQVLKVPARRSHPRSADPARQPLTKTSFPAQHQNVSRGVPRMITIPGTSDHHHLESVITVIWND
jgi:hypothetical protein